MAASMKTEQQLQSEAIAYQAQLFQLDRARAVTLKQLELTEAALGGIQAERQAVQRAAQEAQVPQPRLVAVPDAPA